MIKLSERLKKIADLIPEGDRIADIGTDHAYLPIFLVQSQKSEKPILTDISGGSIKKARDNCFEFLPEGNYELREGDGLEVIQYSEVDTVVIAGMGGALIRDILDWDLKKSKSFSKFILQPRNNGGKLRKYLLESGFSMENLLIVPEGERFCEVMVVKPIPNYQEKNGIPSEEELDFPDELTKDNINAAAYLKNQLHSEEAILEKIMDGAGNNISPDTERDINYRKKRVERIKLLLSKMGEETY